MECFIAAVPNDPDLAGFLGKKGSENGVTFYNRKVDDRFITVLAPTNFEEKFYGAATGLLLADVALISTARIDKVFGESLVACGLLGIKTLLTDDNDATDIVRGAGVPASIVSKDKLLDEILKVKREKNSGSFKSIEVDKAFPVKGIGDVVLGMVTSGTIRKHDSLIHTSGKKIEIRSIQVQDNDMEEVPTGARIGIAVKGAEYSEIDKGTFISSERIEARKETHAKITFSNFYDASTGSFEAVLVSGFSKSNVSAVREGDSWKLILAKAIPFRKDSRFMLFKETQPRIFGVGTFQ